jgi:hypothetical protein
MVAVPSVRIGAPVSHDKLTVFPLFLEAPSSHNYRLSEEALADGTAVVEEVSEGGSVPNLAVDNRGNALVLFVEGQELRGADWKSVTAAGAGEDQRSESARWHGSVLTLNGNLVHGSLVSAV